MSGGIRELIDNDGPEYESWSARFAREKQERRWTEESKAMAPVHRPAPYEGVPMASTDPLYLAREAVLHHQGVDVLRGWWRMSPWPASEGPWSMVSVVGEGSDRTVCRVSADDLGRAHVGVCMTVGKYEIEVANAEIIARMRTREPIIAAECIRLADEMRRRSSLEDRVRMLERKVKESRSQAVKAQRGNRKKRRGW